MASDRDVVQHERDVYHKALVDIYTGRLEGPLDDDGMVVIAIDKLVAKALFVDTEPPVGGYPA